MSRSSTCAASVALGLVALFPAAPAAAQEFTFHAEPGVAFLLDEPQASRFTPGLYLAFRPGLVLSRIVSLQLSYAMLLAAAAKDFSEDGSAHFLTAGLRVRPLANRQPKSEPPSGLFVDGNMGFVRTGPLNRFGFDTGVGYSFQTASWLSLGPVVRYGQIVQPDDATDQDPNNAQFLTVGLDLTFGPAHEGANERENEPAAEALQCPAAQPCPVTGCPAAEAKPCPDADLDGVCDADDRCPGEVGPAVTLGCAVDPCRGPPLVVLVQFAFDSSELPPAADHAMSMDPALDAVAKAMAQDPTCRVCVMGYASEEGFEDHNLALSHSRATAVQHYLVARGLAETRIPTTGMGTRCQLVPEATRSLNRRVEFRRLAEGEACPTDCAIR